MSYFVPFLSPKETASVCIEIHLAAIWIPNPRGVAVTFLVCWECAFGVWDLYGWFCQLPRAFSSDASFAVAVYFNFLHSNSNVSGISGVFSLLWRECSRFLHHEQKAMSGTVFFFNFSVETVVGVQLMYFVNNTGFSWLGWFSAYHLLNLFSIRAVVFFFFFFCCIFFFAFLRASPPVPLFWQQVEYWIPSPLREYWLLLKSARGRVWFFWNFTKSTRGCLLAWWICFDL